MKIYCHAAGAYAPDRLAPDVPREQIRFRMWSTPASEPGPTVKTVSILDLGNAAREVVASERAAVANRVEDLKRQSEALRQLVVGVEEQHGEAVRLLRRMDELLGSAPQLPLDVLGGELRGQRLREIAVSVLRRKRDVGQEIHYTEWLAMLEELGARVGGRNPKATFLTQIAQAPDVESVRPRSGLYRLRAG